MNFCAMSAGGIHRWQRRFWFGCGLTVLLVLSEALVFAQDVTPRDSIARSAYRPDNVFAYPAKLSLDIRRVAVLPLATGSDSADLTDGCGALGPVLTEELDKKKRFEVVTVDADGLRRATSKASWSSTETLPANLMGYLRRQYACDAVLFTELTAYRAYAPLAVGWRLKLVDARSGEVIWAADELFDAAQPAVYKSSQQFAGQRVKWLFWHDQNWVAANSPRQFGRYSAAALLGTLPER